MPLHSFNFIYFFPIPFSICSSQNKLCFIYSLIVCALWPGLTSLHNHNGRVFNRFCPALQRPWKKMKWKKLREPPKYLPPRCPPEFVHFLFSHLKSIGSLSPPHKASCVCWQQEDGDLSVRSSLSPSPRDVWTLLHSFASPLPSRPIPACLSVWDCATILISLGQARGQGRGSTVKAEALPEPGWCSLDDVIWLKKQKNKRQCRMHKQRDRQIRGSERASYNRITADNTNNSASLATAIKCPLFLEDYSDTFTIPKFSSLCPSYFNDGRLSTMFAHFCYLV